MRWRQKVMIGPEESAPDAGGAVFRPGRSAIGRPQVVGFGYRTTLMIGEGFSPLRQQIWDFGNVRCDAPCFVAFQLVAGTRVGLYDDLTAS